MNLPVRIASAISSAFFSYSTADMRATSDYLMYDFVTSPSGAERSERVPIALASTA